MGNKNRNKTTTTTPTVEAVETTEAAVVNEAVETTGQPLEEAAIQADSVIDTDGNDGEQAAEFSKPEDDAPTPLEIKAEETPVDVREGLSQPAVSVLEGIDQYIAKNNIQFAPPSEDKARIYAKDLYMSLVRMWKLDPAMLVRVLPIVIQTWRDHKNAELAPTRVWAHGPSVRFATKTQEKTAIQTMGLLEAICASKSITTVKNIYDITTLGELIGDDAKEVLSEILG